MPLDIDPAWEYWDGGDPEVRELLVTEQLGVRTMARLPWQDSDGGTKGHCGFLFGGAEPFFRSHVGRARRREDDPALKVGSRTAVRALRRAARVVAECAACGREFEATSRGRTVCSFACKVVVRSPGVVSECRTCGAQFSARLHPGQVYCGTDCAEAAARKCGAAHYARRPKKPPTPPEESAARSREWMKAYWEKRRARTGKTS